MTALLTRLWNDDGGQDMAEYAIMLGVIAAVVIGTVTLLGGSIKGAISSVTNSITSSAPAS